MSELFNTHKTMITGLASIYFPNPADAEDAVQEAYIKFAELGALPDVENEAGFIRVITINLFRDLHNKDRRMRELDQQAAVIEDVDDNDPLHHLQRYTEELEIGHRLDDMPAELAQTANLYYLRGMSYKEIADELGVPEGTVASRLNKARSYFQGHTV